MSLMRVNNMNNFIQKLNMSLRGIALSRYWQIDNSRRILHSVPTILQVVTKSVYPQCNHENRQTTSIPSEKLELNHLNKQDYFLNFLVSRGNHNENYLRKGYALMHGFKPVL